MLLSDGDIRVAIATGELRVEGLAEGAIGPASVDLMLSPHFVVFDTAALASDGGVTPIDPAVDNSTGKMAGWHEEVVDGETFELGAGEFALASTMERWVFPNHLAGKLDGKSSLARLGLMVHTTAGFFDPGFEGYPTLELVNVRDRAILLYPGMPVAQMSVVSLTSPVNVSYGAKGGKYAGQGQAPAQSLYHLNME